MDILKNMRKSNRIKFLQFFAIFLLLILYSLSFFAANINGSNEIRSSQEDYPEILAFSNNMLLSIDDSIYAHHALVHFQLRLINKSWTR